MTKKLIVNNLNIYEKGSGPQTALFLHGYGANGRDLISMGSLLPSGTRLLFPEGPISLDQFFIDAHAWFNIDLSNLSFDHRQFQESSRKILGALKQLEVDPAQTIIAGFSQGAMMALEVALLSEVPFRGVGLFSTMPVDITPERVSKKKMRFFQSHGRHDSLLPIAPAKELFATLQAAGWDGRFEEFPGEHEIPDQALEGFREFFRVS